MADQTGEKARKRSRLPSKRRVRRLRRWVAANRCPERPGLTHDWQNHDYGDLAVPSVWECRKCHEARDA